MKKSEWTRITAEQAKVLKRDQPEGLQGLRNRLLITILLDHGARISEVIGLTRNSIDLEANTIIFYRKKTNRTDTHYLTNDSQAALIAYLKAVPVEGNQSIWVKINKAGKPSASLTDKAARDIVNAMGERHDIHKLSPHDLRHYYATAAARNGTPLQIIQQAGGWNSLAMPARYIDAEKISNEGVILDR